MQTSVPLSIRGSMLSTPKQTHTKKRFPFANPFLWLQMRPTCICINPHEHGGRTSFRGEKPVRTSCMWECRRQKMQSDAHDHNSSVCRRKGSRWLVFSASVCQDNFQDCGSNRTDCLLYHCLCVICWLNWEDMMALGALFQNPRVTLVRYHHKRNMCTLGESPEKHSSRLSVVGALCSLQGQNSCPDCPPHYPHSVFDSCQDTSGNRHILHTNKTPPTFLYIQITKLCLLNVAAIPDAGSPQLSVLSQIQPSL